MKSMRWAASSRFNLSGAGAVGIAATVLTAVWALLPVMPQDPAYHHFADQRRWLGVPHGADVLSNVAFALVGVIGVARLLSNERQRFSSPTEAGMWCVASGLICTAIGSAWYHGDPTDATLLWDRLPMTLVFAGVLGMAISQRVGNDVGRTVLALLVPVGIASVVYWKVTGDLSLYMTLQLGGFAGLILLLVLTRSDGRSKHWAWVIGWYALAKIAESTDRGIWDATHGVIAGHTLKHVFAACAGAAVLWPLRARR